MTSFFYPGAERKGIFVREKPFEENINLRKFVKDHYRCSQMALQRLPAKLKYKPEVALRKLEKLREQRAECKIPPMFFIWIIFTIQLCLSDLITFLTLFSKYGVSLALFAFVIMSIFIIMPICMVFFFLSNSTRFSFSKIWLAVPILKGACIGIVLKDFLTSIFNMTYVSLNVLFIFAAIRGWIDCKYGNVTFEICIPREAYGISEFCALPGTPMPPVGCYVFLQYVVTSTFTENVNYYLMALAVFLYALLMAALLYSLVLMPFFCKTTILVWVMVLLMAIIYLLRYGGKYTIIPPTEWSFSTLAMPSFYIAIGHLALQRALPDDLVTYGSFTTENTSPVTMAVLITFMRVTIATAVADLYGISLGSFIEQHSLAYTDCLDITGLTIGFVFIPEHLLDVNDSKFLFMIYFAMCMYMGFMSTFFSTNGFLTAITGDFEDTKEYRGLLVTFVCCTLCTFNLLLIGLGVKNVLTETDKIIVAHLIIYFCVAIYFAFYSTERIATDFYFQHGTQLNPRWIPVLKCYIIFVVAIVTSYIIFELRHMERNAIIPNAVGVLLVVPPIIIFGIIHVIRSRNKSQQVSGPAEDWGAPSLKTRTERAAFTPRRERRMLMALRCNHECLVAGKLHLDHFNQEQQRFFAAWNKYNNLLAQEDHMD